MKVLLWVVGLVAVVALLFTLVFPWFDNTFVNDPVLDEAPAPTAAAELPTVTEVPTVDPTPLEALTEY